MTRAAAPAFELMHTLCFGDKTRTVPLNVFSHALNELALPRPCYSGKLSLPQFSAHQRLYLYIVFSL